MTNERGQLDFHEYPLQFSEYNSLDADQYKNAKWAKRLKPVVNKIEAYTLDEFVSGQNIKPNFIKIDVEGVEDKVVAGMDKLLAKSEGLIIALEYLYSKKEKSSHQIAAEFLNERNYSPHIINSDGSISHVEVNEISRYMEELSLDSDNIVFLRK